MKTVLCMIQALLWCGTLFAQQVGIGTTSPLQRLHVEGKMYVRDSVGIGISAPGYPLHFSTSVGDKISLYGTSGNHYGFGVAPSLLLIHSDHSGTDIGFGYGSYGAFTESMRIKGDGRVGIGTSAPTSTLHVKRGVSNSTVAFEGTTFISLFNLQSTEHTFIRGGKSGSHVLLNDNVTLGNVGIGTATPTAKLDIARGSAPDGTARFQGTMYHSLFNSAEAEHTSIQGGKDGAHVLLNTNAALGNVGIGMGGPAAKLDVVRGTATEGTARFQGTTHHSHFNSATAENTYIRGGKTGSHVLLNDQAGLGNVGIGTGNPMHKLHVNGNAKIDGHLRIGYDHAQSSSINAGPLAYTSGTCECPEGTAALGGGFNTNSADITVIDSYPSNYVTWRVEVFNNNAFNAYSFVVYAICARLAE